MHTYPLILVLAILIAGCAAFPKDDIKILTIDIDIDGADWRGQARLNFQGPNAFVTVSF
jgi:hypothetical protein